MGEQVSLEAVGRVVGGRTAPIDEGWDAVDSSIVLDDRFDVDALSGLTDFSHVEVVFHFHLVDDDTVETAARHPRGRDDWPLVGVFAQRNKARPNRIGVSTCRLMSVEGRTLHVRGLDAIDGTPVLDIKPHVSAFGARGEVREPAWIKELMKDYW